jgi:hypothetical protein
VGKSEVHSETVSIEFLGLGFQIPVCDFRRELGRDFLVLIEPSCEMVIDVVAVFVTDQKIGFYLK